MQINRVPLPATLLSVSLYRFFPLFGLFFFYTIFPFGLFFFILTADPAGHALGSIYILSLSPKFYFGKGISKALDLHTGQAYDQIKTIRCQDVSLLLVGGTPLMKVVGTPSIPTAFICGVPTPGPPLKRLNFFHC